MTRPLRAAIVALTLLAVSGDVDRALGAEPAPRVLPLRVDGAVSPASADYIHAGLRQAEREDVAALVIELDTPGGLLSSTRTIVKDLLAASVPTIVYVAPSGSGAASAGVFVVMAANVAARRWRGGGSGRRRCR